MKQKH
jgi:hypothetical protein